MQRPSMPTSRRSVVLLVQPSRDEGATLREDLDDNATLYGETLANSEIATKGRASNHGCAKSLELPNRYSAKERKNYSHLAR